MNWDAAPGVLRLLQGDACMVFMVAARFAARNPIRTLNYGPPHAHRIQVSHSRFKRPDF